MAAVPEREELRHVPVHVHVAVAAGLCLPAIASAIAACHTAGPAIASTVSPWSCWNIITAPRVIVFGSPGVQSASARAACSGSAS